MFQKLRFHLTALCTAVTGLILAVLTLICLSISENGMRRQDEAAFQTNLNTMYQTLQQQTTLSHSWIRQTEQLYHFSLRIRDNGTPLFFQNLSESRETLALLDLAEQLALEEQDINMETAAAPKSYIFHKEFSLETLDGRDMSASVALIPRCEGTLGVTVLYSDHHLEQRILVQRRNFLVTDLAALALLSLFFWFFIARMLRPLEENRKKQMQFIASASHELRSPLAVILSNTDAVRNKSMPADKQFLDTITEEGRRMSRLIGDMLQLASADNHNWNLHLRDVEMDTLVLQTWEAFEALAHTKKLGWSIQLPQETVPPCCCDPERIRQLLAILIDNAFSYTPAGGLVHLSLVTAPSCLQITVADNGPGIPEEQKKMVFERFYCVDSSHKNKAHFGLGLSIAREIAKLHRGQLLLTDTPGGGASFTLVLPVQK